MAYLGFGKGGGHGEHAEHEPIMGAWGQSPSGVPGQSPVVRRSGGEANHTGRKITKMDFDFENFEDDDVIAGVLS